MLLFWTFALCAAAHKSGQDSAKRHHGPHAKSCGLEVPLTNDIFHQRYVVKIAVGTPPQTFGLALDTASSDIWVPSANSTGCYPNCPPPTFDPADSSTIRNLDLPFDAIYGLTPDLHVTGEYYNDTLQLEGVTIHNMTGTSIDFDFSSFGTCMLTFVAYTIAVGNVPPPIYQAGIYGLFGVGSRYAEALFSSPSSPVVGNKEATYDTIYDRLKNQGVIKRRFFSLWLNKQSAKYGSLLFGGVDRTKYHGELKSTPVLISEPNGYFRDWAVNLTSVTRISGSSGARDVLLGSSSDLSTILDSGSPNMYMPAELANAVATQLNASMVSGFPYVDCKFRASEDVLEFQFAGPTGGPRIKVPYPEIIYPFGAPSNVGNVTADDGSHLCYLGLIATDGSIRLLGDTFLRSAYVVYDVDNLQISMAQAVYEQ